MTAKTNDLRVLLDMLPDEVERYFAAGGDLAILPIGSIEHHGPHLINGCDGYITLAKAQEVARLTGGVLFPMHNFSWEGATNVFSGGVGVREQVCLDYLRAAVRAVRRAGFTRILIINSHGGNFYGMRALAQQCLREDGIAVLTVYGHANCEAASHANNPDVGEAGFLLGALHMLGRDDLVEDIIGYTKKAIAEFGDRPKATVEPESLRAAQKLGAVGQDYYTEWRHVQPDSTQMSPDAGARLIRLIAEHIAKHLDALGEHADEVEG